MGKNKDSEFSRLFIGLGVSKSVTIARPSFRAYKLFISAALIIIFGSIIFFALNFFNAEGNLAKRIPVDSVLYASIKIPSASLSSKAIFWKSGLNEQNLCSLYNGVDFFHFGHSKFCENIFPLLKKEIEIAKLREGEYIFSSSLAKRELWLSSAGLQAQYVDGQIEKIYQESGGWILSADENSDSLFWMMKNDILYVSSSQSALEQVMNKRSDSIARKIKGAPRGSIGLIYANDFYSILGDDSIYAKLLSFNRQDPLILFFGRDKNKIIVETKNSLSKSSSNAELDKKTSKIENAQNFLDADFAFYGSDISLLLAIKDQIQGSLLDLNGIAGDFYGISIETIASSTPEAEFSIMIKDEDHWIIIESSQEYGYLKELGTSLFAISHPVRIEKTLPDNSIMTELRSDAEGLEWSEEGEFLSLQSQGEENGYFVGSIKGLGSILTNYSGFLDDIKNIKDEEEADKCGFSGKNFVRVFVNHDFLSRVIPGLAIDSIVFGSKGNNDIYGCAVVD